ncbi:MAG: carboxypeptidase regulatory-like domain-containing protein [Candidatus Hydrogenedentes bacterium]|nr:carboxypeptidase regulatory-like domain-containing protein [Candidatus Hydrogenedentota bacterium]
MFYSSWLISLSVALAGASGVNGLVVGPGGQPVAQATVYLECGENLTSQRTGADGVFRFDGVVPGVSGVFAVAEGLAYGGATLNIGIGETVSGLSLRLGDRDAVSGKIVDPKGKPIAGARIAGVALLGDTKVGIPLAKLEKDGLQVPVSGADGRFTVTSLPKGGSVAIKVNHIAYAQEAVGSIGVGDQNVRIAMNPGVLVRGNVLTRDRSAAVMNATITIKNNQPPYDSLTTQSNSLGTFELRLKPGVYLCQAATAQFRSPGWEQVLITGEQVEQKVTLRTAGLVPIHGKVFDAVSGGPVVGAHLTLISNGSNAAVARTGPTGEYQLLAVEGENTVRLDSAPGYQAPPTPALRVTSGQGQTIEMPDFWLAPTPAYKVQVIDGKGQPVQGAIVRVLRPVQFGWNVTGADGRVSLGVLSLPSDGKLVGMAEHPSVPMGAVFALKRANDAEAKVELLRLSSVRGRIVSEGDKPIPGAVVGALFADDAASETMLIWRTLSRDDGSFEWSGAVPYLPQRCLAYAGAQASGESKSFNAKPGDPVDLGSVTIRNGTPAPTLVGKPLKWLDDKLLCGEAPARAARKQPAVVMYCSAQDAPAVIDAMTQARQIAASPGITYAVVVSGQFSCGAASIPVYSGEAPAAATTYLMNAEGKVVQETFDLPPIIALRSLAQGTTPR